MMLGIFSVLIINDCCDHSTSSVDLMPVGGWHLIMTLMLKTIMCLRDLGTNLKMLLVSLTEVNVAVYSSDCWCTTFLGSSILIR